LTRPEKGARRFRQELRRRGIRSAGKFQEQPKTLRPGVDEADNCVSAGTL
jgi:hypothetical protein